MLNLNFLRSFLISKPFIQKFVGSSILIDLTLVRNSSFLSCSMLMALSNLIKYFTFIYRT